MDSTELLTIKDLSVSFLLDKGSVEVVDKVSLSIRAGKTMALVGESGCGKSVTASSIMRLLPYPYGQIRQGSSICFDGKDLLSLPDSAMYKIRGSEISMIFQEPMTALNPVHLIGKQIREVLELHRNDISKEAMTRAILDILEDVEMPSAEQRMNSYPFQLSGGMRQRVMIAMALACHPKLLIADEPTTALDVTVQAQIISLIRDLQRKNGMAVLYITHDMGVVADVSDDVTVMYAGQIVETGPVDAIFKTPLHPYTIGLIGSMPLLSSTPKTKLQSIPGNVPAPRDYPATCRFAERCRYADDYCRNHQPQLEPKGQDHYVRCFKAGALS